MDCIIQSGKCTTIQFPVNRITSILFPNIVMCFILTRKVEGSSFLLPATFTIISTVYRFLLVMPLRRAGSQRQSSRQCAQSSQKGPGKGADKGKGKGAANTLFSMHKWLEPKWLRTYIPLPKLCIYIYDINMYVSWSWLHGLRHAASTP